jgi:hypothetical protein
MAKMTGDAASMQPGLPKFVIKTRYNDDRTGNFLGSDVGKCASSPKT